MQEKIFEAKGRLWLLLFMLMSIGLLTISCKAATGPTQELTKEIQGTVSDALDHSPICGASVELMKITGMHTSDTLASTLTDNNGFYYLKYIFQDKKDCDGSIHLLVGYNLFLNDPRIYKYKNIHYSDTPHVYCAEGLQRLDVTLDRW